MGTGATTALEKWLRFHLHNDGSVRDTTYIAGNLPIYPQENKRGEPILCVGMRSQQPYGLEIITEPYAYESFMGPAQKTALYFGHIPQNPRTSIHVHVDAHNETWREIQNLMIWARALEAIIYRVACGGTEHRGCKSYHGDPNDHKFARPLSMPIGIHWGTAVRPLIQWDQLINATSASQFVASWGRLDTYWENPFEHYMPHRLHMINLSSILRTGTIEWRVFDGMYAFFDVLIEFVYKIHALAAKGERPDFQFDLGQSPNVDAEWVSKLLNMDIAPLWGTQWQKGCVRKSLLSHYPAQPQLHTVTDYGVVAISNGIQRDLGSETFPLYIRGTR